MALYKTRAIAIKSINLSESDRLVTFMTENHGKIKCVAKGARKIKNQFWGALEPMSLIHLIYFKYLRTNDPGSRVTLNRSTRNNASTIICRDIFDLPNCRSTNMIGTSAIRNLLYWHRNIISMRNE